MLPVDGVMSLRFKGQTLVKPTAAIGPITYQVIEDIRTFDKDTACVIVPFLDPNLFLLFGHLSLIVTEKGSVLSHLAILALEHGIPVVLVSGIIKAVPPAGNMSLKNGEILIHEE